MKKRDGNVVNLHKRAAVDFLKLIVDGQIDEAYEKYVSFRGEHHNPFFPRGFRALQKAMIEDHARFPSKKLMVKNVLGDGDMVAVQSHLVMRAGESGMAVVHLFRFRADKIVEMWDCAQLLPPDSPNKDGAF